MRLPGILLALLLCAGVRPAGAAEAHAGPAPDTLGTYIVTFAAPGLVQTVVSAPHRAQKARSPGEPLDVASASARDLRASLAADRELLLASAERALGRTLPPLHVYDLALHGVALSLSREEALALAALPGIRRVEPERTLHLQTDLSPAWLGTTAVWNAPAPFGSKGEGVVIGIIDSGLNRQHPSFAAIGPADGFVHANPHGQVYGRCVAVPAKCNGKVIGIYDYTDEGLLDGIDQSNHGSLVAGIAAGNAVDVLLNGAQTRISGIAPHASLIVYKTCISDANGSCAVSDVIAALEQAIADGVDVVNLSLGYAPGDPWACLDSACAAPWDALGEVLLNVHAAGIVGVVAAGNAGPMERTVLVPGAAPWVITVASARHDRVPARANELAGSSSRGPGLVGGYLVPDVTAPGVDVLGAGKGPGLIMGFGTSMASPQVAGASALLRGAHPDWTVADVASALVTTARPVIVLDDGAAPAGLFDQGAGLVDLSRAQNAGLSLRIDSNAYRAADPHQGGSVAAMNEPALILDACFRTCSVTRTFTALTSGSWSVVAEAAEGVSVSAAPAEFTLTAGQSRAVTFSIDAEARVGEWTYGALRLQRTDATAPETRLPLAVFADAGPVPDEIVIQTSKDAGFADIELPGLVALPDATFAARAAGEVFTRSEPLPKGPTANPFTAHAGGADGAFAQFVTIPANSGAVTLKVETLESPAVNVQLYAGYDANANGNTEQTETTCASTEPADLEYCEIEIPNLSSDAAYWFIASNREASTPGATDPVTVRWVAIGAAPSADGPLTITGPGHVDSGAPFSVRVAWKDFSLTPGAARESELLIGTHPDRPGNVAAVPLKLVRSDDADTTPAALVPGEALSLRLPPGEAEDRLYIDVPPNATALTVTLAGSGEVNVFAAHAAAATGPAIAPAPARELAAASSSAPGADDTLSVGGPQLLPGRWYLTPVNSGGQRADFTLTATLSYGGARAELRSGAYYNPARSGAGGFFYRAGGNWAYLWYTYRQDGTPTWVLGANAAPGPQTGTWVVPLLRFAWDGAQANGTRVGEGILTLVSPTQFQFSWNLDGESGSETYRFLDGGGCPAGATADLTGSWFAPALSGYGYSINVYPNVGSVAAYFYDDRGLARWAIGIDNDGPETGSMTMSQYQGVGPLAPYQAPTAQAIGTFERSFTSQTAGQGHLDVQLAPPLSGGWSTAHALQRLTDPLGCE